MTQAYPRTLRYAALLGAVTLLTGCATNRPTAAAVAAPTSVATVDPRTVAPRSVSLGAGDSVGQQIFLSTPQSAVADARD